MSRTKLFCIPYAGGSAMIYKKWEGLLGDTIELIPIELAGRGKRSNDPLYQDVPEAVQDIFSVVSPKILDGKPYAFFGHSMGAMLAYEVIQKIRANYLPEPQHAFFSGRGAPHVKSNREKLYHEMEDDEFKREIMNLGGTPKEFFDYPELVDYLLPILKNDFKISEIAEKRQEIKPLNSEITVLVGKEEDELEAASVHGWMQHSKKMCTVHYFNGGHFFINDEAETITKIIKSHLSTERFVHRVL